MKRALITGASGDIGQATCHALAKMGYDIIAHANSNLDTVKTLAEELNANGSKASCIQFDVSDPDACKQAIESLLADGPIQVLVNNAGIHEDAILAGMSTGQWQRVIDVNLNGFFNVTQPIMLPMMQTRWGRVISVSSIAGVMGNRGQANYAASKAGLIGASKSLAIEMASRGITVNVVAPGIIEGAMTEGVFDKDRIKQAVPMQRAGTPAEVAAVIAFLASDDASYVSGQVIGINGAMA